MPKFKLVTNPTFDATVKIPTPGGADAELKITFKHMKLSDLRNMQQTFKAKVDKMEKTKGYKEGDEFGLMAEFLLTIADGWELEEPFDRDTLLGAIDTYPRFFDSISSAYQSELWSVRQK